MKRFAGIVTLAVLNVVPFSYSAAQAVPAIQALRAMAPDYAFEMQLPEASAPASSVRMAESLSGEQLFQYLHEATAPSATRAVPSYKAAKAYMYSKADNTRCNGSAGILTFYSQVCVNGSSDNGEDYKEKGDLNKDGVVDTFVNAEHIWPQSYFKSALPMVSDLHHLQSTFATPNGRRGNLKFCKVTSPTYSTASGSKLGKTCFEPADAVKGNVARSLFYFIVRYNDKNIKQGMDYNAFWTKNVPMLLEWNRMDPPDANEKSRNDLIESFQGNRNPFVDDPQLAERIGEVVFEAH